MSYSSISRAGFFVLVLLSGCGNQSPPTEQMTFRNVEYTDNVVASLKRNGISFERTGETTIVFLVDKSQSVMESIADADADQGIPLAYQVFGDERKDALEKLLSENSIPHKVMQDGDGGYSFFIDKRFREKAQQLFHRAL